MKKPKHNCRDWLWRQTENALWWECPGCGQIKEKMDKGAREQMFGTRYCRRCDLFVAPDALECPMCENGGDL